MTDRRKTTGGTTERGQFLVYQAEDGRLKLEVRLADETVWLTQPQLAELFQTTVPNISMHLKNIFEEGELRPEATVQNKMHWAITGQTAAEIVHARADSSKPNMTLTEERVRNA